LIVTTQKGKPMLNNRRSASKLALGQHKLRRKGVLAAGAVLVTIVAGTGLAAAAGVVTLPFSGDGNTINGCYSPGGQLMVLTATQHACPVGMTPIHWSVTGPPGAQGPTRRHRRYRSTGTNWCNWSARTYGFNGGNRADGTNGSRRTRRTHWPRSKWGFQSGLGWPRERDGHQWCHHRLQLRDCLRTKHPLSYRRPLGL
jgi:hypothetical protein